MAKRLTVRLSDEIYERVTEWADKLGVTQSQLGGMAVHAGIDSIIRAVSPVDAIPAEKMAQIIAAMETLGLDTDRLKNDLEVKKNEAANRNKSTK